MTKETIIIQQEITIEYSNLTSKNLCIARVLNDTNWMAFSGPEGTEKSNDGNKYYAGKTNKITLIKHSIK